MRLLPFLTFSEWREVTALLNGGEEYPDWTSLSNFHWVPCQSQFIKVYLKLVCFTNSFVKLEHVTLTEGMTGNTTFREHKFGPFAHLPLLFLPTPSY